MNEIFSLNDDNALPPEIPLRLDMTKIMKEQRSPPFKFADKRFRDAKGLNLGPGEYDKENYFDWNKKSYNILYL